MNAKINLAGKKIGRLLILSEVFGHKHAGKHRKWRCLCDCGNQREIFQDRLVKGTTVSCGCWQSEVTKKRQTTHGMSKTPLYKMWAGMIARCSNKNLREWKHYGGRGISVCERWKSFDLFLEDMGELPFDGAEIDRIDNDSGYSPENCRWATRSDQCNNTRQNVFVTICGETKTVAQWARMSGVADKTIRNRLRAGVIGRMLLKPPHRGVRHASI